jgi:hypothetical protein
VFIESRLTKAKPLSKTSAKLVFGEEPSETVMTTLYWICSPTVMLLPAVASPPFTLRLLIFVFMIVLSIFAELIVIFALSLVVYFLSIPLGLYGVWVLETSAGSESQFKSAILGRT